MGVFFFSLKHPAETSSKLNGIGNTFIQGKVLQFNIHVVQMQQILFKSLTTSIEKKNHYSG